ncbi:LuxR C-terminal-related transcriptional regulator [Kitasatospora sp. NPDC006697]|uniref:helix-turn-helix transcriptional regulator n=1 Tax=Kitasatospora sp. NPDC006697 TaxID=3364020 RepID=UPI0036C09567
MPDIAVLTRAADPISQAGLQSFLRSAPGLRLVERPPAGQRCAAVLLCEEVGDDVLGQVRELTADPEVRVVLVVGRLPESELLRVVGCGIASILWRHEVTPSRLVSAVFGAHGGRARVPADLLAQLLDQVGRAQRAGTGPGGTLGPAVVGHPLNDREADVLRLIADGLDTGEIAARVGYSERWVKNVLHGLTTRLHLRNRSHAVAYALRQGLL